MPNPRFPLYIPTKSRAETATTPRVLDRLGVPYRLVIEADQHDDYARWFPEDRLLHLDPAFQTGYETLDDLGMTKSLGPGPARNFAWAHSMSEGYDWHWVMDDNITSFYRLHRNRKLPCGDGTPFAAMEAFSTRYQNIAMSGPHYLMFAPARSKHPPFVTGTRVYSCNLIRNAVAYRWRGRYNEDTILSLDLLKAGWATVQFLAFLQGKVTTQILRGGNSEVFYDREGTLPKSRMLVDAHPDVSYLVERWGRWHHFVEYGQWRGQPLIEDPDWTPPDHDWSLTLRTATTPHWVAGSFFNPDVIARYEAERARARGEDLADA
jgi:hypothetical protein